MMLLDDMTITYTDRHGRTLEPPASTEDEDLDIERWEAFRTRSVEHWRCVLDGSQIHVSNITRGQTAFCDGGHRWWLTVQGFDNIGRSGHGHGWRRVS